MKLGILQQHNTADIANNKTRLAEGIIDLVLLDLTFRSRDRVNIKEVPVFCLYNIIFCHLNRLRQIFRHLNRLRQNFQQPSA